MDRQMDKHLTDIYKRDKFKHLRRSYITRQRIRREWMKAMIMIYIPLLIGLPVGYLIALQIT